MALASIKKLTLVGLINDKDTILDAVVKSGAVQLTELNELSQDVPDSTNTSNYENILSQLNRVEQAIKSIKAQTERHNLDARKTAGLERAELPKRGIAQPLSEMSFDAFSELGNSHSKIFDTIQQVEELVKQLSNCTSQAVKASEEMGRLGIYSTLPYPPSHYKDTETVAIRLGIVPAQALTQLNEAVQATELAELDVINTSKDKALIVIAMHKSVEQELLNVLSVAGFTHDLDADYLPMLRIKELESRLVQYKKEEGECRAKIARFAGSITELEIFYDYTELQLKKAMVASQFATTQSSFVLQGFYPEDSEQEIEKAINAVTDCVLIYFNEVSDSDDVPVLYKNNKFFQSFQTVTDMYSPPSYREIDPNPIMSIFYIVIFGLMVADMGYGLVLCLAGLFSVIYIKQETGIKRLGKLFGICGFGAIAVGALYGTAFSVALYPGLLPDSSVYPKTTMVICILFGIVHLTAGVLMSFAKELRRKNYVSAYGVSLAWAVFFAGAFLFVLQPALSFMDYPAFASINLPSAVSIAGIALSIASLAVVVVCAGHGQKIGGRLVSAFANIYGILNHFSDAMSYIRIFGLMLSSAMMGVVINMLAQMVMSSGVAGILSGIVLLVFAHLFNLVIGVLGVYIHDGRLQYMEFFGKFYEGDGRLFLPFGRQMKYTLITENKINT